MQCTSPIRLTKNIDRQRFPDGLSVPCGKCMSCRVNNRNMWVQRMIHELPYHSPSLFLTLTYDDDHLPLNRRGLPTLRKSDWQKFMKRLRKEVAGEGREKLRYMACGEYGPRTQRPHLHAVLYGLSASKSDREIVMRNWTLCDWDQDEVYKNSFGSVTPASSALS